ncbi:hypothetical protein Tco_0599814 [Tanacetum coccineum]
MHEITNPELIKRLHDNIPKSVDEMMMVIITFLRREVVASKQVRKKTLLAWKQQEAGRKQNFERRGDFRNQQRSERRRDKFTFLVVSELADSSGIRIGSFLWYPNFQFIVVSELAVSSAVELYMMNRPHGRMILASVEKGPLVWPTITVDGVTRPKEYTELTPTETIQADCDIKAINIILQGLPTKIYALQFQVKTKFLNTLPAEWSKFITDVKLVKDLHTTNVDQIHAHFEQHERHANEVRLMHKRNSDPLALVVSHQMTQSPYQSHQHSYQNSQHKQFVSPYQSSYQPKSKFPQLDSGLTIPVFKNGDDPIDAINHVMSFLSVVVTSRYPTTNNQLRNSSNLRQQATINDGRVTVQPIQGRQISYAAGEGTLVPKQCTKPRRKRDDSWFKDKVLLVQAQASGQILHEEELAFLTDTRIPKAQATQTVITHNAAYQADDLDAYALIVLYLNTTKVALMANFIHYGSGCSCEVLNHDNVE